MASTFLTAEWRKLAIANYSIDPEILTRYLPYKTQLDYWEDKCYVSLVGFRFINTILKGIAVPLHKNFEEINLRFYVKYKEDGSWKRGVTFIKEIVPRPALTFIANSIYNENYITLPTKHSWNENDEDLNVSYEWKHKGDWDSISITAEPVTKEIIICSEEEFITEHYWGYTKLNERLTSEYQVAHPRWEMYPVRNYNIKVRFSELYGIEFGFLNDVIPDSVMLAEGSVISVMRSKRIK